MAGFMKRVLLIHDPLCVQNSQCSAADLSSPDQIYSVTLVIKQRPRIILEVASLAMNTEFGMPWKRYFFGDNASETLYRKTTFYSMQNM